VYLDVDIAEEIVRHRKQSMLHHFHGRTVQSFVDLSLVKRVYVVFYYLLIHLKLTCVVPDPLSSPSNCYDVIMSVVILIFCDLKMLSKLHELILDA